MSRWLVGSSNSRLAPLTAGQHPHRGGERRLGKTQTQQGGADAALIVQAAHILKLFPQGVLALQQVGGGIALREGDIHRGQFLLHRHHRGEDALHLVPQGAGGVTAGVLLHIADGGVAVFYHVAAVVGILPHQDAQEGGLATAIVTHQTDAVAVANLKG